MKIYIWEKEDYGDGWQLWKGLGEKGVLMYWKVGCVVVGDENKRFLFTYYIYVYLDFKILFVIYFLRVFM